VFFSDYVLWTLQECRIPFGATSFYDHDGLPYCETHFHARRGSLCVTCNKPVTGRCVTAMYRKYHPEHFVCTYCQRQLNKGTFKEQNNKPYCQQCFVRLFAWRLSFWTVVVVVPCANADTVFYSGYLSRLGCDSVYIQGETKTISTCLDLVVI